MVKKKWLTKISILKSDTGQKKAALGPDTRPNSKTQHPARGSTPRDRTGLSNGDLPGPPCWRTEDLSGGQHFQHCRV